MSSKFHEYLQSRQAAVSAIAEAAIVVGLPVFPCGPTKQPMTAHGFKDASADPAVIRRMFTPTATMIGVPTGELTGFVVVDVDIKENRQGGDWLDANSHRMPQTRTIKTGSGGLHLYFSWPGQKVKNSNDKIAPGIDVRGDGGYVIVPPSPGYRVADDSPMADLPDWLLPILCPPEPVAAPVAPVARRPAPFMQGGTPYGLAALSDECDAIMNAPFGSQESTLNSAGLKIGALVAGGELQESEALAALLSAARGIPSQPGRAPWSVNQLEAKARRAFTDGKRAPRGAPEPEYGSNGLTPAEQAEITERCGPLLAKLAQKHIEAVRKQAVAAAKPMPVAPDIMQPGGVLQMIMEECKRTAIRAQPFLWLGSAISAVGTLAGRRYESPSGLRTNVYIAAVAESGSGKDHAPSVVRRAFNAARLERYLGGEDLASGSGLLQSLAVHPARLFILDELGMFLRSVTGKNAAAHKAEIWSEFIKIYSRAKEKYNGKEYANKDGKNERVDIWYPHPVVYGMTTPSTFWSSLEGGAMLDGGLARFLLFLSDQDLPPRNKRPGDPETPEDLIAALQAIAHGPGAVTGFGNLPTTHYAVMSAKVQDAVYRVPMTDDAEDIHDRHMTNDQDGWSIRRKGTPEVPIISRLGENAIKLALIRAISTNATAPVIGAVEIEWGWQLALHCTRSMLKEASRFIADSDYERKLNKTLDIIQRHGPITEYEMLRRGFKSLGKESERRELLHTLTSAGLVTVITQGGGPSGGRPTVKYAVCGNPDDKDSTHE